MDREAELPGETAPPPPPPLTTNLWHPIGTRPSSPALLRDVQAAFKRHRPLAMRQSIHMRPKRSVIPKRETSKSLSSDSSDSRGTPDEVSLGERVRDSIALKKNMMSLATVNQDDASITPSSIAESERVPLVHCPKKVQFAMGNSKLSLGYGDKITTVIEKSLTHMSSLALTDMDWDLSNQVEASAAIIQDMKPLNSHNNEVDANLRSNDGISSLLAKTATGVEDQLNIYRNFLQSDFSHHVTQPSVGSSSCATTTLMNSTSAPMLNSTTECTRPYQNSSFSAADNFKVSNEPMARIDVENASQSSSKSDSRMAAGQVVLGSEIPATAAGHHFDKRYEFSKDQQSKEMANCDVSKDPPPLAGKLTKGEAFMGDVTDIQSQAPITKEQSSDVKAVASKAEKQEKPSSAKAASAPRKRNYDPDLFFKVNGKLYQRLGKIGSGGSSEVHKVISQDCTIYALKKIKLRSRDYATAFGFCQEIEYLNRLKGKNHIIQLIDYEVTDKALLKEVMSGSICNKEGRVKEEGVIYMVLEYGEIDLAHMLSQKWKELDSSKTTIDENWLRFYWQQILLAVNTIHEERIVHSDLKPANFLLVRGSLKLIDFGIAKAIMSDTTNIQRDSQVGTLSYMSPEAFMCNETDANGNTIKCGRPSDIWSLGCILYQMVYGRTPFSEHKTFWAKFKVITDPKYEITYEPLSNVWLLDLMKKCLAWDRNERWRIPQLLQHPFLNPPIPPRLPSTSPSQDQSCKLLQLVAESCTEDPNALILCSQLGKILMNPVPQATLESSVSLDQQRNLLSQMSKLCLQLEERLANSERE